MQTAAQNGSTDHLSGVTSAGVTARPTRNPYRRNRYTFGIGTLGHDMLYTLMSMFLIYYFTNAADVSDQTLGWIVGIVTGWRIFDAITDPLMGIIVDNTHSRFGKHKPWIALGGFGCGILTILIFANFHLVGTAYVVLFALFYILWSLTYAINDIAYWSYLPALTQDQRERENISSKARIVAMCGTFFVVAAIDPITKAFGKQVGSLQQGYFWFAILVIGIMWAGQCVTLFGVNEPTGLIAEGQHTSVRDFFRAIFKNDQLLIVAISMVLFMIGYTTTTGFGIFYFEFVYGNTAMYSVFAIVLGLSQIAALIVFPYISKHTTRKSMYLWSTVLVVLGYVIFWFAPTSSMVFIGISGFLLFVGQGAIQLLMLLFLADTVDYGHWKLGKRNDSVTFSLNPFINKLSGAIGTGITGIVALWTGMNHAPQGYRLVGGNLMLFKSAMFVLPLVLIVIGYLVYHFCYRIDERRYAEIQADLVARGEIKDPAAVEG